MTVLVIDVGTTSLRAGVVGREGGLLAMHSAPFAPSTPFAGLVEFDPTAMAAAVLDLANAAIADIGSTNVTAVGIATQRASTIVWDRTTGVPIGPGLGWQDLRTVGECIVARAEHGLAFAPNQSATKIAWLLANSGDLDRRDLCFGTVDTWIAWTLSGGEAHITDHTNAAVTGLMHHDASGWNAAVCDTLAIPVEMLPTVVDSSGICATAHALSGAPPIAALVGDQQASLVGQSCVRPGLAKITFGTGGMLDVCGGHEAPVTANRSESGTYPVVAWSANGRLTWATEAIMLSAGTNVEWLRDDLGLISTSADSHDVAASCDSSAGVVYVPALLGLGTPHWDYGARGTLLGITRGTERSHVVRAVLEGVAHRGADMVEAAEADSGLDIAVLRLDGGMSENPTFVQAVADATGKPVEVSPIVEATTMGAGYLAGAATGLWSSVEDTAQLWSPRHAVEPKNPSERSAARNRWQRAVERSLAWIPELTALDF